MINFPPTPREQRSLSLPSFVQTGFTVQSSVPQNKIFLARAKILCFVLFCLLCSLLCFGLGRGERYQLYIKCIVNLLFLGPADHLGQKKHYLAKNLAFMQYTVAIISTTLLFNFYREGECYLPSVSLPEIPVPIRAGAEDVTSFSTAFSKYPWFNTGGIKVRCPPVKQFSKQVSPLADRCKTHQQHVSAPECSKWDPCLVVCLPGFGSHTAFVLRVPSLSCRE